MWFSVVCQLAGHLADNLYADLNFVAQAVIFQIYLEVLQGL